MSIYRKRTTHHRAYIAILLQSLLAANNRFYRTHSRSNGHGVPKMHCFYVR